MSNRRLLEKAQKLQIQKENPSLWTGLRKPGQPSKIFNRAEAEAEYQSNVQAEQELTRRRTAELEGGAPTGQPSGAPTGQPQPSGAPTGQPQPSGAPTGQPSGAVGSNVGFSGVAGSKVGFSKLPEMRETFAEADARTRREKTLSGAFGEQAQKRAENLEGRKGLFAEMKASSQKSGGDIPMEDMTRFGEQAKKLGIADENFERTAFRVEGGKFPAPTAAAAPAPLTGSARAQKNIAEKGIQGAAADYFKRAEAEKVALEKRSPLNTVSSRFAEKATSPVPASRKTFAQTFGSEMDRGEPSPALKAARENTIAARTKADTMRADSERSIESPVVTPAAPAATATPAAPARPAPTSLFGAIREDASGAASTVQNVGSAARLIAARGVEKTAEGAGKLIIGGARLKKEIDVAAKKKALDLIPGRTGEYLRNR